VGLIGAVALPLVGVASGCVQMARGVYNTPEALGHVMAADAVWDEATGRWSNMSIQVRSPRACLCVCVLPHTVGHVSRGGGAETGFAAWGFHHQERHASCEREFAQWQRDHKEATAKAEAQEPGAARAAVNGASLLPQVAHMWSG